MKKNLLVLIIDKLLDGLPLLNKKKFMTLFKLFLSWARLYYLKVALKINYKNGYAFNKIYKNRMKKIWIFPFFHTKTQIYIIFIKCKKNSKKKKTACAYPR